MKPLTSSSKSRRSAKEKVSTSAENGKIKQSADVTLSKADVPVSEDRKVTLRDIAKKLGISHVSVSLALRDGARISESLRRQVRETAEMMGYRPNPIAAALGQRRSAVNAEQIVAGIAWVNFAPENRSHGRSNEEEAYLRGARETAKKLGYSINEFVCNQRFSLEQLLSVLRVRNISGVLLPAPKSVPTGWGKFPWNEFAVVEVGQSALPSIAHSVASDTTANCLCVFKNIQALGYSRLGLVTVRGICPRLAAEFLTAQMSLPEAGRLPIHYLANAQDNIIERQKLRQWVGNYHPDAILTDHATIPLILKSAGYRIPRDIAVAGLDVGGNSDIAGINLKLDEVGCAAVDVLIDLLRSRRFSAERTPRKLLIAGEWVSGPSLPRKAPGQ